MTIEQQRLVAALERLSKVAAWALSKDFEDDERDELEAALANANQVLEQRSAIQPASKS